MHIEEFWFVSQKKSLFIDVRVRPPFLYHRRVATGTHLVTINNEKEINSIKFHKKNERSNKDQFIFSTNINLNLENSPMKLRSNLDITARLGVSCSGSYTQVAMILNLVQAIIFLIEIRFLMVCTIHRDISTGAYFR